ncbi:MAG: hypothetical protein CMN85_10540 [Spongiibacteraceae bacterium]|nr:hypothetical protein [Spongiibacteraceae bacterium]
MSLAVLCCAAPAFACERLNVAIAVSHFGGGEYNEYGPLLGCERAFGSKWSVRYFKNSHDWDSFLVTRYLHAATVGGVELGAEAGMVSGYRDKIPSFAKLLNPALKAQFGEQAWNVLGKVHPWGMLTADFPITDDARGKVAYFGAGVAFIFSLNI